jgi:hypothetical protein
MLSRRTVTLDATTCDVFVVHEFISKEEGEGERERESGENIG